MCSYVMDVMEVSGGNLILLLNLVIPFRHTPARRRLENIKTCVDVYSISPLALMV